MMKRLFKGSGILNLLGMTAAFAALYILLVQVYYEMSYNRQIEDSERIYVMACPSWFEKGKYQVTINRPVQKQILEQASMVESCGVAFIGGDGKNYTRVGEGESARTYQIGTAELTRGALDVFGFKPVVGTFEGMDKEATVAISEKAAKLMGVGVGDAIHVGKSSKEPMEIVAVYEDMPNNSDLNNIHILFCYKLENEGIGDFSQWSYNHFVKLDSPQSKESFEAHARKVVEDMWKERFAAIPESARGSISQSLMDEQIAKYTVTLFPFEEMYFSKVCASAGRSGNRTTTITLLVVSILIVLITLINFVNFFFAQVPMRLKSVNTRKILGSSRGALVWSMMMESGLLVAISLSCAVAVVVLFKSSTYANLISCPLDFGKNTIVIGMTIMAALLMTVAASVYPSLYITSFPPVLAIKGSMGTSRKGKVFRYSLIVLQFAVSIGFVISAMLVKQQHSFMMNYDMGFNKEHLLTGSLVVSTEDRDALTDELLKSPHIKDVAWAVGPLVNSTRMSWGRAFKGETISIDVYPVSWNFLRFMGVDVVEGRDFTRADEQSERGVFVFNRIAKEKYGLTLEDKLSGHNGETDIAGFCNDFQFRPLQYDQGPFAFYIFGQEPWWDLSHLYIRTEAGAKFSDVEAAVKEVVLKFNPGANVSGNILRFFEEELGDQYYKEKQLTTMVSLFTILAIIISLMGVLGLVMFETQYRRKEIGLRRVHGSSVVEILKMFNIKFVKLLLVAFVIAAPISLRIMDFYYSTFAYSAQITIWTFLFALLLVAVIVCTVVTIASLKAATENPVNSLRSE